MQFLKDIFYLFFPKICVCCQTQLIQQENSICIKCIHDIPLTHFYNQKNNPIEKIFLGRIDIKNAMSFMYYREKGSPQKILFQLKEKNNDQIAKLLANWIAFEIKNTDWFKNLDVIIGVPLHKQRERKRGFNQLDSFGNALSKELSIPYLKNILVKNLQSAQQKTKNRIERWSNVKNSFSLTNENLINDKHILLIDDVITTGATLESCAQTLKKAKNVCISIVTIAYAE